MERPAKKTEILKLYDRINKDFTKRASLYYLGLSGFSTSGLRFLMFRES